MIDLPKVPSFVSCGFRSGILVCGSSNALEALLMPHAILTGYQ